MSNRSPVAVLIPTRGRPQCFQNAVESIVKTSLAWIVGYLDDDTDGAGYPGDTARIRMIQGPRIGVTGALNVMAEWVMKERPYTEVIAMMTDDSLMVTSGWDDFALRVARRFHKGIGVISPRANKCGVNRVDQPAITMGWYKQFGYFAHKELSHYCWPSILGLLSDRLCLYRCTGQEWEIEHHQVGGRDPVFAQDAERFYEWVVWYMEEDRIALERKLEAIE